MKYTPALAKRILDDIRLGSTMKFLCSDKRRKYPPLLEVYDWLKDTDCLMADKTTTFNAAYQDAMRDRALTWQDMAANAYENLDLTGRNANALLTQAGKKAQLLVALTKEQRMVAKDQSAQGVGGANAVTITIRTFADSSVQDDAAALDLLQSTAGEVDEDDLPDLNPLELDED